MKSNWFKQASPHIYAILFFLVVSIIYCQPALMGKVVEQHDIIGWKGMAQQSFEFKEKYGHFPLWSNSMFGGMPAYTFTSNGAPVETIYLQTLLTLGMPVPVSFFFLACISFYFLCMVMRIRPLVAALAAIAYAWATYDPVIIAVGHNTKMWAIGYAPAVVASLLLIYEKKYLTGGVLLALFFGLLTSTQHIQVLYYTAIVIAFISIAYLVNSFRNKEITTVLPAFGVALLAAVVGLATYAISWYPLQEYSKETMRGGRSEITEGVDEKNKTAGGLNKDYAFGWSYGISETLTFIVPSIYGGSSGNVVNGEAVSEFGENTRTAEVLAEKTGMQGEQADSFVKQLPAYWGAQPGTSGPVYLGAIICFLFILGMVYVRSWHKWWILAATIVGIILAWGKNFSSINYFLFDYLPFYNKFRAPSMAMIIPQLTFPLLAALGLEQFMNSDHKSAEDEKKFRLTAMITGAVILLLTAFYFMADYSGAGDAALKQQLSSMMMQGQQTPEIQQQAADFGQSVVSALRDDRKSLFGGDLLRSTILILLAGGLLYFYRKSQVNQVVLLLGLLAASTFDLIGVGTRYLSHRNFVEPEEFEATLQPNAADLAIKADTRLPFRVFDQSTNANPFESSRASYFHNSVGGYSPAKLGLYNDLIQQQLSKGNMQVFNMLNTRYFIMQNPADGKAVAQSNPEAFGPAWFVREVRFVKDGNAEMKALDSAMLREVAIVQEKYQQSVGAQPQYDSASTIQWVENLNDKVIYKTSAATDQFAVFSEIFYDKGWNAYLDGKLVPHVKANYVLRGMKVPAGNHELEFRFEPKAVQTSKTISTISASLVYLLLALTAFLAWKRKQLP
ncbi:YfhO family protein [Flavihumibacter sp. ZG627]|uniref:YfhO family protein n=1 Tax=Flavihumibacter sp. ZG627 TaxID=1463156 RepID=UPI000694C00E|nr:YfhO family protein [Flavihumibacter sp. ZG627]